MGGFEYTAGKVLKITFPPVYYMPTKQIAAAKQKTKICRRLVTADQDGQKNRNEKTIVVLFRNVLN